MISVSTAFLEKMSRAVRPKLYAEVEWRQLVDGAAEGAGYTATHYDTDSLPSQLSSGTAKLYPYAVLESGRWPLDGTRKIFPDGVPTEQVGAWSDDLADVDGEFTDNMILSVSLSSVISSVGLTIYFDSDLGAYPETFIIRVYNGVTLNETINATTTNSLYVYFDGIDDYDGLEIEVTKWSAPGQRARIAQIKYGIVWVKTNTDLVGELNVVRQIDPVNDSNPASQLVFSFDDRSGEFNWMNPAGSSTYIVSRQKIYGSLGFENELVSIGAYYMSDWKSENGTATLQALDSLSLCDVDFTDATYTTQTLTTIAAAALTQAGVTDYSLDSSLDSISVTVTLENETCLDVLSDIATAACLTLYADIDSKLIIGALPASPESYTINYYNSPKPTGTLDDPLKSITVGYTVSETDYTVSQTYEDAGQEISVTGNPFIVSESQANAVLAWLEDYYLIRENYQNDWRQNPMLEAGDIIGIKNDYATPNARILSQTLTYSAGGLSGQTKSKGVS